MASVCKIILIHDIALNIIMIIWNTGKEIILQ